MNKPRKKQIIKLYDYQTAAYRRVVKTLVLTARALMVMATGLGKTVVAAFIARRFMKRKDDTLLFLCHDTGILDQAYVTFRELLGDRFTYTKFYGRKKNWTADEHNFVFATFQSLSAYLANKNKKSIFSRKHFKYIIVDESHHTEAESYAQVVNYFKSIWKLGMTATPDREDNKDIRKIFGKEVVNYSLAEGIAKGWLTPVDYRVLADGIDNAALQELCEKVTKGEIRITKEDINKKVFVRLRTKKQCDIIRKDTNNGGKAIIFCRNIEHLRHVKIFLPSSTVMHSHQSPQANERALKRFKSGKIRHVLVVDKFNEGMDVPRTEFLNFLRGTSSRRIFLQQLGRGLRRSPGKRKLIVRDFVANIDRIQEVQGLMFDIKKVVRDQGLEGDGSYIDPFHIEGAGFRFDFSEDVRKILDVLEKQEPYLTWQEASIATRLLGIKSKRQYRIFYKKDKRLRCLPEKLYSNFPEWSMFLGPEIKKYYSTWQEASIAARKLDIGSSKEYIKKYKNDPLLPPGPNRFYSNFPGFYVFLSKPPAYRVKNPYSTWQEASIAAQKLNIKNDRDYREKKLYKSDQQLPGDPSAFYENFPGWKVFLQTQKYSRSFEKYSTWQEASIAAQKLNIKNDRDYREKKLYKSDSKLPADPSKFYSDFPGMSTFLGKN